MYIQLHLPVSEEDLLEQRESSTVSKDLFPNLALEEIDLLTLVELELDVLEVLEPENEESCTSSNITLTLSDV